MIAITVLFAFFLMAVLAVALIWISWVYFDGRYRGKTGTDLTDRPAPGFQPTAEVFIDPKDEKRYRVYYNPATGDRQYVEEP